MEKKVTGYGFNERTLGLWRPWELCQALDPLAEPQRQRVIRLCNDLMAML